MATAVISNNGQITIPASIRRQFGWTGGTRGIVSPFPNGFVFVPLDARDVGSVPQSRSKAGEKRESIATLRKAAFGKLKGKLRFSDDFDAPLEVFRDYM